MEEVKEVIQWLMIVLPVAVVARVVYCLCWIAADSENEASGRQRIRNALVFLVIAEAVTGLLAAIASYY